MTPPKWFSEGMLKNFGHDPSISAPYPLTMLFDHMRTEGDVFVSEPYLPVGTAISLAMKVAKALNCKWHLEVEGDHHPRTVKVSFHQKSA
jgi:hypothetical protein